LHPLWRPGTFTTTFFFVKGGQTTAKRAKKNKATWVFSPKKISIRRKNFWGPNKEKTQQLRYVSIPSGGPPGGTHTQELWYSLRGIDADLESVLSTDKCSCMGTNNKGLIFFGEKTHVAKTFVFAPFRVRRSGHQQQRATFRLNLGWRPFQPRKKRLEEEHHYYYVTRGQERDAASTHNNKKKKKKVSLLPTHQTRKKEELVNKRIVVVVAVVSCEKTFRSSFVPKKSIISRRRRINAREKDEQ